MVGKQKDVCPPYLALAAADSTLSSKFVAMTQSGSNLGSIVNETLFISGKSDSVFSGLLLVNLTTPFL